MSLSDQLPFEHGNARNGDAMFSLNKVQPNEISLWREDPTRTTSGGAASQKALLPLSRNSHQELQEQTLEVHADKYGNQESAKSVAQPSGAQLSAAQVQVLETFMQRLAEESYTKRTAKSYGNALRTFLKAFPNMLPNELNPQEIEHWLHRRMRNKKLAAAQHNTMISAIQLYYQLVENILGPLNYLKRPKAKQDDPKTMRKEEVQRLLKASGNLKNRCLLLLTYAAGLRVMEVLSLRKSDINLSTMSIFVQGRGDQNGQQHHRRYDRSVPLSSKLAKIFEQYLDEYAPAVWLFEGNQRGHRYSERSAQLVMQQAAKNAGLGKISLKVLRASYAAHQLEAGISVSAVQDLMGHNSIRTTTRFAHVAKRKLPASPADNLEF